MPEPGSYLKLELSWCTEQAREESVRIGWTEGTLEDYLHTVLRFARDFHGALNPAGARLLFEGPPPLEEGADRKLHSQWLRITGTVWTHDDPAKYISYSGWRDFIAQGVLYSSPVTCNRELVTDALDA